jgi:hypothetical protein
MPQVACSLAQQLTDLHTTIQAQKHVACNKQQAIMAAWTTAPKPIMCFLTQMKSLSCM